MHNYIYIYLYLYPRMVDYLVDMLPKIAFVRKTICSQGHLDRVRNMDPMDPHHPQILGSFSRFEEGSSFEKNNSDGSDSNGKQTSN